MSFIKNNIYTKDEIYSLLNVPRSVQRGAWDTGYRKYNDAFYIFCNVGVPGRTGHNYDNHWEGEHLIWYAKNGTHIRQPLIKEILEGLIPIYIFSRTDNSRPFTYNGAGKINRFKDSSPVKITWERI